jgi:uncharacterized membrane protein required for colicin V production
MFTSFDTLVITLMMLSCVMGQRAGLFTGLLSLSQYFGTLMLTMWLFRPFLNITSGWFRQPTIASWAAIIVPFIISMIVLSLLKRMLGMGVSVVKGGGLDRVFGLFLGFFVGLCLVALLHTAIVAISNGGVETPTEVTDAKDIKEAATDESNVAPEWLQKGKTFGFTKFGAKIFGGLWGKSINGEMQKLQEGNLYITPNGEGSEALEDAVGKKEDSEEFR